MAAARSIGLWMFRWRSRRRVVSVTRRYVDFLFNREETVVSAEQVFLDDLAADMRNPVFRRGYEAAWRVIQSRTVERIIGRTVDVEYIEALNRYANASGTAQLVASLRMMPDDTELQLPPSDESKVGDDV